MLTRSSRSFMERMGRVDPRQESPLYYMGQLHSHRRPVKTNFAALDPDTVESRVITVNNDERVKLE